MADRHPSACDDPTAEEIRAVLGRIAASAAFRASPRLTAFLRYIVERALAGEGGRLKGYTIAVEALGRGVDFDPQADPIVRVEAGRLRRRLEHYFAGEGAGEPVVIELPLGSYVPRYRTRDRAALAAAPTGNDIALMVAMLQQIIRRHIPDLADEIQV
jgi:hypothetical protein